MDFRKPYTYSESKGITFTQPTMTQQHFKEETDINYIVNSFASRGLPLPPAAEDMIFNDVSSMPDCQEYYNYLIKAQEDFEALPSKIRTRFNNSPMELLNFLGDESNLEEAVRLGLVNQSSTATSGTVDNASSSLDVVDSASSSDT